MRTPRRSRPLALGLSGLAIAALVSIGKTAGPAPPKHNLLPEQLVAGRQGATDPGPPATPPTIDDPYGTGRKA